MQYRRLVILFSCCSVASVVLCLGLYGVPLAHATGHVKDVRAKAVEFATALSARDGTTLPGLTDAAYWGKIQAKVNTPGGLGAVKCLTLSAKVHDDLTGSVLVEQVDGGITRVLRVTLKRRNGVWVVTYGPVP